MTGGSAEKIWTEASNRERMLAISADIAKEKIAFENSKGKERKSHAKALRYLRGLYRECEINCDMMGWNGPSVNSLADAIKAARGGDAPVPLRGFA